MHAGIFARAAGRPGHAAPSGPHGVDGPHSRYKNPISLLANQVTRGQQRYTVQVFSRTFACDLFGANLNANVTVWTLLRKSSGGSR